ncbi:glycosyltransferase family 4 protein [Clostridium perfringens]|uniref:glycosyltransferase family 4 protein n=1 Tax=Clostridium perfringens TaxID=1502 RepID=UPI0018E48886|nr:glycosyltransferase family 4 protein [Clostridium perfringens]MBI6004192.1 glycosyltransferase family 4 protein [Clostridium perfringens]
MNITILSLRGPSQKGVRGGAREYIEEIAKGLIKKGHSVKLVCGVEPKQNLYESEIIDGLEVIRVGKSKWSVSSIIKYYKKNLERNTEILIENMVSFPMYTNMFTKKKHYTIVHHLTGKEYFKTQKLPIAILGYFMEKITLRFLYKKSKFIAVSNHTKDTLLENGIKSDNISIISPGIRDDFFKPGEKSLNPEIFYVGRYSAFGGNKKVDDLIEAFKNVENNEKKSKLIIAGKGDGIDILKNKARGYNVEFLGLISDEEKRERMQKAWIFASPSLAEGFGITWIEANACGTPVVGYKIDGLDTVNDKNSIMVDKNNKEELSKAMLRIIEDENLRINMNNNSIINARKFTWKESIDKINKLLTS